MPTQDPMVIENYDLTEHNTMGVSVKCRYFASVTSVVQIKKVLTEYGKKADDLIILGGGSNVLFRSDFEGIVIHNEIPGKEVVYEDDAEVHVRFGAGENWNDCVLWAVENNLGGIENLSLIPGSAGAAPIQNIGAYGVELELVFIELEALNLISGEVHAFSRKDCRFGYRDSIFKNEEKGKYLITYVTLRLQKKPQINLSYKALSDHLKEEGISDPGIREVSDAVIAIRRSKLPDPDEIGNTGSFFKNPVISEKEFNALKEQYPDIPSYSTDEGVKVPAAWLIDKAGWKGKRSGDAGVHEKQALVLVNYGNASGEEIWDLALQIQKSVREQYGIELYPEVNVI